MKTSVKEIGWVLGRYAEIGLQKRLHDGWYAGLSVQRHDFSVNDEVRYRTYEGGMVTAKLKKTLVLAKVGYQW